LKDVDLKRLKQTFSEICAGFTEIPYRGTTIYFKHMDNKSSYLIDKYYEKYYDAAVEKGLPSEEQKLKELNEAGSWTDKDEADMQNTERYLRNMEFTKSKMFKKVDIQSIQRQIDSAKEKLLGHRINRIEALGMVAEQYADRKANDAYLYYCLFSDAGLKQGFFKDQETFFEFEETELREISDLYLNILKRIDQDTLQKICVSPFFQNMFYLCGDNLINFFGKPVVDMTFYQIDCLRYGAYFKRILSDDPMPPDIADDPEKIIDLHNRRQNAKEFSEKLKGEGAVVSVVGASKKELEELGIASQEESVSLFDMIKKSGKTSLDLNDMIKASGK
jgi:hypothetical protein